MSNEKEPSFKTIKGTITISESENRDNEYEASISCSEPVEFALGGVGETPLKALSTACEGLPDLYSHDPELFPIF